MFANWRSGLRLLPTYLSSESVRTQWRSKAPFLLFAIKSALAAACSWEIATLLFGQEAGSLAPVSAVIIVQVTSWQTVRKSIERIVGILVGVILAILMIHLLGVSFWTILLLIFCAQIVGLFVQKRGQYLATQIPISAVLVLVVSTSVIGYPWLRLLGALIGGLVGTLISLVLSPPIYITRARESIAELTSQIAAATTSLAAAVAGNTGEDKNHAIYERMRTLEGQLQATREALSLGFDNLRLNPWAYGARSQLADYPEVLTAIHRIVRQLRRIAYTINDSSVPWHVLVQKEEWARVDADLLLTISKILAWIAQHLSTRSTTRRAQGDEAIRVSFERKAQVKVMLDTALQQLTACEDALLHMERAQNEASAPGEQNPLSKGYVLSLRGTTLTDLRRILQELNEILALLPPQ